MTARRARSALLAALLASGSWVTPGAALAQGPAAAPAAAPAEDTSAQALTLAREGVALYQAGSWAQAEAKFAAAEALLHSPVFQIYIARSQRNAGRLLAARETYRRTAAEVLGPDAPPPWQQALVDARAELAALAPTIPSLVVRAAGASPSSLVTIDGQSAGLGAAVELDPGPRRVIVVDGLRRAEALVELRAGERARAVELTFPAGAVVGPPPPPGASVRRGSWVPGAVVTAIGVVGLGVGTATGLVALGKSSEVEDACPGGVCSGEVAPGQFDDQLGEAATMADVSTVAFLAGGVLTGAGIVLLITRPFGGDEVVLSVAPRGVQVGGAF